MNKEPKIRMKNLHWVYGEKTGLVPYIYNNKQTAIKLYHEDFGFEILQLGQLDDDIMWWSERAERACNAHFKDKFEAVDRLDVYEQTLSMFEKIKKEILDSNKGFDELPFSSKELGKMVKRYNNYMETKRILEAKQAQKRQRTEAQRAIQEATMDF